MQNGPSQTNGDRTNGLTFSITKEGGIIEDSEMIRARAIEEKGKKVVNNQSKYSKIY